MITSVGQRVSVPLRTMCSELDDIIIQTERPIGFKHIPATIHAPVSQRTSVSFVFSV